MKNLYFTLITLLVAFVSADLLEYVSTPCKKTDMSFQYMNRPISFTNGEGIAAGGVTFRKVDGVLIPKDGCSFQIQNFVLVPTGGDTYFYGIPKGQPDKTQYYRRIVPAALGNYNGITLTFTMQSASWNDMDGIAIYSEADKAVYAKAFWVADKSLDDSGSAAMYSSSQMLTTAAVMSLAVFLRPFLF